MKMGNGEWRIENEEMFREYFKYEPCMLLSSRRLQPAAKGFRELMACCMLMARG